MLGIFLDVETTGLDPVKHRVIEIAAQVYHLPTGLQRASFSYVVRQPQSVWAQSDPVSLQVNGFTWEEVSEGEEEVVVSASIQALFCELGVARGKAVFICQNPAFDRVFFAQLVDIYRQEELKWPYHWLDFASMYWAYRMQGITLNGEPWPEELSLSKDSIAAQYELPKEVRPHRAINGVEHLVSCYTHVVGMGGRLDQ